MANNKLKLNDDKTELLVIGRKEELAKVTLPDIEIGECHVSSSRSARNIGIIQDTELNMKDQINAICRSAYLHLQNIGQVRKYLDRKSTEAIVHAFVTSRLDNGNALLYGLPKSQIDKLQRIQNMAARIIVRSKKYEHITPHLKALHWLPVQARIEFKINLLTYKAVNGLAPVYLEELLIPYTSVREVRRNKKGLLHVPQTKMVTCGDRAFSKAAPVLWNRLPAIVRQQDSLNKFKSSLKHFLFEKYYAS